MIPLKPVPVPKPKTKSKRLFSPFSMQQQSQGAYLLILLCNYKPITGKSTSAIVGKEVVLLTQAKNTGSGIKLPQFTATPSQQEPFHWLP